MPANAMMPSNATNPIGVPVGNIASTMPISPNGAMNNARSMREKRCNWTISRISITNSVTGNTANTELLPLSDSSTTPPSSIVYSGGKLALIRETKGESC